MSILTDALDTIDISTIVTNKGWNNVKVIPFNCLPQQQAKNFPYAFIINTDPAGSPGKHWYVQFHPSRVGLTEIFDSFGRQQRSEDSSISNNFILQHPLTSVCGYYCLLFIQARLEFNMTLQEFVTLFEIDDDSLESKIRNDRLVLDLSIKHLL